MFVLAAICFPDVLPARCEYLTLLWTKRKYMKTSPKFEKSMQNVEGSIKMSYFGLVHIYKSLNQAFQSEKPLD